MRSIIFSNYSAFDTQRLGATIDVEHSHLRFLGHMTLNLWDCGGQDVFIDNYFTTQRDHIFRMVEVLIHVFDVQSKEVPKDIDTFVRCLKHLREYSPDARVFVLLHKMDLVAAERRDEVFSSTFRTLAEHARPYQFNITGYATSIWDESLYKAWSSIVCSLIPNMGLFQKHLETFASICNAQEVILFERTTFLVISHVFLGGQETNAGLDPKRFEKISNIMKTYKQSCNKMRSQFQMIALGGNHCSAYLEMLTQNTFIMVVTGHSTQPDLDSTNILSNIKAARTCFDRIEAGQSHE